MSGLILADFSPPVLAYALKANLHDFFRQIARATQTESLGDPELTRWHTQVPFPWFNGVLASRPPTNGDYLGYLDGRPVATANLFLSAGVAGVQFVATLPEARGQGLGGAMSLAPLLEARQMGYGIGVLQSSAMGFPLYRRLGFRQVCQVEHYYWAEASASEADGHRDH